MFKHIPNILTIIRILLIPVILFYVFYWAIYNCFYSIYPFWFNRYSWWFIARKFNLISNFGKLMDPLADKLTQIATLTSLVITDIIPIWILVIVLLKEFIMIVGASFLYGKDVVVYSRWYGKLATVLFYIAIVASLLVKQFGLSEIWANLDFGLYCLQLLLLYLH